MGKIVSLIKGTGISDAKIECPDCGNKAHLLSYDEAFTSILDARGELVTCKGCNASFKRFWKEDKTGLLKNYKRV